jgi:hypothetical protein
LPWNLNEKSWAKCKAHLTILSIIRYTKTSELDKKTNLLYPLKDSEYLERKLLVMNQSASKNYMCEFHWAGIAAAVLLIVGAFLLSYAGSPTLSWFWILGVWACLIPAGRRHMRWHACTQDDPREESGPKYE